MDGPLVRPLTIRGRDGVRAVRFPVRALLAPMEGVTDPAFRRLVLALGDAGGATTEFLRITNHALSARVVRRELGPPHRTIPQGVQFMAPGSEHVAGSVAAAERAGAAWVDLNFGCPVRTVFGKGAGAALLDRPEAVAGIVAAAVGATTLPVSAKIRAGVADAGRLREVVAACADAGAAMLTVHARLRTDRYSDPPRPEWIAMAVDAWRARRPGAPLVGNGGIDTAADAHRMAAETGCDAVMVGRGAMADPFVFGAIAGRPPPTPARAARFLLDYLDAMRGVRARHRLGRVKQLLRGWRAGGLFDGREELRGALLRDPSPDAVRTALAGLAGERRSPPSPAGSCW